MPLPGLKGNAGGAGVFVGGAGSQTYASAGTFTFVCPGYSTMTVDVKGSGGVNNNNTIFADNGQCDGGFGAAGGRAQKTFTQGNAGAPIPGQSYTVTVGAINSTTDSLFASQTNMVGQHGGNGVAASGNTTFCTQGSTGGNGTASGGDINTTGGGAARNSLGSVAITWS